MSLPVELLLTIIIALSCAYAGKLKFEPLNEVHRLPGLDSGLKFASYYGDHMVLQKGPARAAIWGYAKFEDVGKRLTLSLKGRNDKQQYETTIETGPFPKRAVWKVQLDARYDRDPVSIKVNLGSDVIQLKDILFGDIWLCGGQSNMEFTVVQALNATAELEGASKYPNIRVFTVSEVYSDSPRYDLKEIEEAWSLPSKASLGGKQWKYFSAVCWMFGRKLHEKLGYPVGLVASNWGGTPVEAWSSPDALAKCHKEIEKGKRVEYDPNHILDYSNLFNGSHTPSDLWNAMIHPLINMTITGAIWYQGEANQGAPDSYNCTFPAMIQDWREKFNLGSMGQTNPNFPFGFVQLAGNRNLQNISIGFPDIRWHQTADVGYVPNQKMQQVFMAVAMDLPDFESPFGTIHPRDKEDVTSRLVLGAMDVAYNQRNRHQGPFPSAFYFNGHILTIEYDYGREPIQIRSQNGFEVCCAMTKDDTCGMSSLDGWYAAPIVASDSSSINLDTSKCSSGLPYLVGLRYAWRETPCPFKKCAVYSVENELPAAPYINMGLRNPLQ